MKTFQEFLDFHKDFSFDGWKEFPFDDYKCLSGEFSGKKTIVKDNKKGINRENPLPVFITPVPKIYPHLGLKKRLGHQESLLNHTIKNPNFLKRHSCCHAVYKQHN